MMLSKLVRGWCKGLYACLALTLLLLILDLSIIHLPWVIIFLPVSLYLSVSAVLAMAFIWMLSTLWS